jgi:hypothetical protein
MVHAQGPEWLRTHESLVGYGANLINEQICFLEQPRLVDQGDSKRKVVLVTPYLGRAHHHNGGGVASAV